MKTGCIIFDVIVLFSISFLFYLKVRNLLQAQITILRCAPPTIWLWGEEVILHFILIQTCNISHHLRLIYKSLLISTQLTCLFCISLCSLTGSSSNSETFNNGCLSHSPDFSVKDVEVFETFEYCVLGLPSW